VTITANDANASMLDMEVSDGIAWVYGAYRFQPRWAGALASAGRHVTVLAWEESDVSAVRSFFSRDAMILMHGDEAPARGDAVEPLIRSAVTSFTSFETTELDFTSSGRLAVLVGEYNLGSPASNAIRDGHYTALLTRDGRDWKIRSLILD
jgi:ketosteroid isomerase-like protein